METDIPDRIITEDNTRLWRFKTAVMDIPSGAGPVEFRSNGPVEVLSNGKVVGWAVITPTKTTLTAEVAVDYNLPERLDVDNGAKVWLAPVFLVTATVDGRYEDGSQIKIPTVVQVLTLHFTDKQCMYIPPIGATL